MKKFTALIMITIFCSLSGSGQEMDSTSGTDLPELSRLNLGNSYITFPGDIGNLEPLWLETNLIPNFYIRKSKNSRLTGVLTPQIILRMYQDRSYPVRTPSYIPQITIYYSLNGDLSKRLTLFGRYAHHSNGQDGDFFNEDGKINLLSGDFSTNYFETGIISTSFRPRLNAYQFFKSSVEVHPEGWSSKNLKNIYSKYRLHNDILFYKLRKTGPLKEERKAGISVKGELTWMFGELDRRDWYSSERLNLSLNFSWFPGFLEDIGLFVQYYRGFDYYNIYFNHHLETVRFGLITEQLRF